jgi:ribonuclease P protein component
LLGPERDESYPKDERVRRRSDYLRIQHRGQKFHTKSFLFFVHKATKQRVRFGVTVSRKVGIAVERNRTKRLLREFYRRHKGEFQAGVDVVVVAKREAVDISWETLCLELRKFLQWLVVRRGPQETSCPAS